MKIKRLEIYASEPNKIIETSYEKVVRLKTESRDLMQKTEASTFLKRIERYRKENLRSIMIRKLAYNKNDEAFDLIMETNLFSEEEKTFILFSLNEMFFDISYFDDAFKKYKEGRDA
jgi:hypothetical protein